VRLAGTSVTKTATLLGISRARVSKGMWANTNHGKTTSERRNSGRKSAFTKRDRRTLRRTVSKNDRTTQHRWQDSRTEYSSRRPFFHKNCPTWASQMQLLNLWSLKAMLRCVNDDVTTIIQDIRQLETRVWCGQMSCPSRCSLDQEGFTFGEHPRKPAIRNAWFQQWNTGEVLWWLSIVFCWYHYYPSWPNYCKGVRGQVG
jgi:hypothetical protein